MILPFTRIFGITTALAMLAAGIGWQRAGHWHGKYDDLRTEAGVVLAAIRDATGQEAKWDTAPGQIVALGQTARSQRVEIETQNARFDEMAREAVRLKATAARKTEIAEKAIAGRNAAYARLSEMAISPAVRSDCLSLLAETEKALSILREASE